MTLRDFIDPVRETIAWPRPLARTSALSPARRIRRAFISVGLIISLLAFVLMQIDVLSVQWIEGMASPLFMFGTACLIAAGCTVFFSIITIIGVLLSLAFNDDP